MKKPTTCSPITTAAIPPRRRHSWGPRAPRARCQRDGRSTGLRTGFTGPPPLQRTFESAAGARAPAAPVPRQPSSLVHRRRLTPTVNRRGAAVAQADDRKMGKARPVAKAALYQLAHGVQLLRVHRVVV